MAQGRLSAGLVDQAIASKMSEVPPSYLASVREEYEKRRDVLYEGLSTIKGVVIPKPEGAFYAIVKLPVADAEAFCQWLLTDFEEGGETVMLAPAAGFYATAGKGIDEVRIAYVLSVPKLKRSIQLIAKALAIYAARV
jgi:aspartate aminotransferase